jgi:hypothetical protein
MTEEEIVQDVLRGADATLGLFLHRMAEKEESPEAAVETMKRLAVGTYLSAMTHSAHFLVMHDGEVTPQLLERAVAQAAHQLGYSFLRVNSQEKEPG